MSTYYPLDLPQILDVICFAKKKKKYISLIKETNPKYLKVKI